MDFLIDCGWHELLIQQIQRLGEQLLKVLQIITDSIQFQVYGLNFLGDTTLQQILFNFVL